MAARRPAALFLAASAAWAVAVPCASGAAGQAVSAPAAARLLDVDGDGTLDKLLVDPDGTLRVLCHAGGRRFVETAAGLPAAGLAEVLVSDLDGNGTPDLYLVCSGPDFALLGDGRGGFSEAGAALGLGDPGAGLSAERVDLDGDGRDELLVHDAGGDVLYWKRADGRFERDADTPSPGEDLHLAGADRALPGTGSIGLTPEQARMLAHMQFVALDDGFGNPLPTIRFTGVNLQLVDGLGATNGNPADPFSVDPSRTATNGLGNLVVGYAEPAILGGSRQGSHNLVVGTRHVWSSFGGLLAGDNSTVSGPYRAVSGGVGNSSTFYASSCGGGILNIAENEAATVSAGSYNIATGMRSTVSGGAYNIASGAYATVSGGEQNFAEGINASISGGNDNRATGSLSSVAGGSGNIAAGYGAAVVGGEVNIANGDYSAVLGGLENLVGGDVPSVLEHSYGTVAGGRGNRASGLAATVSGGGGPSPGDGNTADGDYATVSGGRARGARGEADWAAGALFQDG